MDATSQIDKHRVSCEPEYHRHAPCAWCARTDRPTASARTADGRQWPPLCLPCAERVRAQRAPGGRETGAAP